MPIKAHIADLEERHSEVRNAIVEFLGSFGQALAPLMELLKEETRKARQAGAGLAAAVEYTAAPAPAAAYRAKPESWASAPPRPIPRTGEASGGLSGPQQRILDAIAWWNAAGIAAPNRTQVAFVAR
jgi:hypothetical protein